MRAKCSVFIATSLDGYIARPDGGIDWLERAHARASADEDFGYARFMASVDALVMGRRTFEQASTFPAWPYGTMRVHVLSERMKALPGGTPASVSLSAEAPRALVDRLTAQGARHLYVDGGVTIQRFLREGLIDEITITRVPVLLGSGTPLFGALDGDLVLEHVATHAYPVGFVQSTYRTRGAG